MQTVNKTNDILYEVKKSTFYAYLTPYESFKTLHVNLKNIHPKSRHIVWAYRYLNEFNQVVENSSDDGEPKGTSGPPSLNALRGADLINCGVLIARYFGGIKLGTGGLVRAYGSATNCVIDEAELVLYEQKELLCFSVPYSLVQRIEHYLEKMGLGFGSREFNEIGAVWELQLTAKERGEFLEFATPFLEFKQLQI